MKCPVCPDATLSMSNREGIEIDYCPACRGVWLDRGELDKIIERSAGESQSRGEARQEAPYAPRGRDDDRYRERDYDDRYRDQNYQKRKRKGLLGELFDFD
ncbi:MAG TPA: zf-TFIIB domain-containing protein [Povalibacter sp.]|uniref:TFIIB-type zinc ribbon-containing protein n=1 Tax=Povalibacter sp. TaxID=1962978 RepID=UPI002BAB2ED3|nr:zf-TFIIB domain-containing protein [Povalibacter sp.]HMN44599.1 zf-TFIIB domain-containing protein [Povalibacter sp.]